MTSFRKLFKNSYIYSVIILVLAKCQLTCCVKIIDKNAHRVMCSEIPKMVLSEVLGAAFNSRYMSVTAPNDPNADEGKFKRGVGGVPAFYAEENFVQQVSNKPAWPWSQPEGADVVEGKKRRKRDTAAAGARQWQCESTLRWIDLGSDYYPQYLRSVECMSTRPCWFGRFKCKPRSFTVKLLRRKRDRCVVAKIGSSLGMEGLPVDLRELWVWEERAVNFCCECTMT